MIALSVVVARVQEAGEAARAAGAHEAGVGAFEPFFPGWVILLPLLGFVANAVLALHQGRREADGLRRGEEWTGAPPRRAARRPATHTLPIWIGPGVVGVAFVLVLVNFLRMHGGELHDPVILHYWTWMVTGTFQVDAALQLDQLSMVMMLVVTGVGFLIHVFSVGYMRDDPGYARYFAYLNLFVFFGPWGRAFP